jgi:transcription termination factor Rho
MKKTTFAALVAVSLIAIADVPDAGVIVSTEAVSKTVSREPRQVSITFSKVDGSPEFQIEYETVTRIDGSVISSSPFKSVSLNWIQVTNLVPSLAQSLVEFRAAAHASLTNSP